MRKKDKAMVKKIKKGIKGITLIALVVTIIVLLILAGVAINLTIGSNGIFTRAQNAVDMYERASRNEEEELNKVANFLDKYTNGGSNPGESEYNTGTTVEEAKEQNRPFKETTKIKDDNNDEVPIPTGFSVHPDSNTAVDEGIIITDGTNEFVWVPVDDTSTMFTDGTETLTGVTTTTDVYSKLRVRSGDMAEEGKPGDTNKSREPDVLSSYDTDSAYYQDILGFKSTKAMADSFVDEYKKMSESVNKYSGFYIGRYELTGTVNNPTVKSGDVLTASSDEAGNWYGLYKACKNVINNNSDVKSTMIYGCQWDETMSWLKKNGYNTDRDSNSWGNYSGSPVETGNDSYKANEIYDLAGNYLEWTQEAYSTEYRTVRGNGDDYATGGRLPASGRSTDYSPETNYNLLSSRVTLYIS